MTVVSIKPGALELRDAAAYTSLSVSLFQQQVQKDPDLPRPIHLATRRAKAGTLELF